MGRRMHSDALGDYQVYGDITLLNSAYSTMTKYLAYLDAHRRMVSKDYAQMGDWGQLNESTPKLLVENCAYYYLLTTMASIARLTDHAEDAIAFSSKAALLQARLHNHPVCYQPATQRYGNSSQASYGCVLFSGIILEENKELAIDRLVDCSHTR